MTADTTHRTRSARTERGIACATTAAPLAAAVVAPFLSTDAAVAVDLAYLAAAGLLTANVMDALPETLTQNLPAGDILRGYRLPLFLANLTTGTALAMGTLMGPAGTDALVAGLATIGSEPVPGIVSLGWWATVALVPYQLRNILRRPRLRPARRTVVPVPAKPTLPPDIVGILRPWAEHISNPDNGTHRGQILTVTHYTPGIGWKGTITAPAGQSVTVREDTISSVYRRDAAWITFEDGTHTGERHVTVHLTKPAELDTTTLQGAWKKWVAKPGGLMSDSRLIKVQDDPNTGGQVGLIVAGEDQDRLRHPDRMDLAGALRVDNPLLISYEPRQNPRQAVIRKMTHNPLQEGTAFPGLHVLKVNENGYIHLGRGISGFPTRIQLWDPALGAQHVVVCGVTGSGKGGTLQIIALAHHANGHAIINADPKGSSNPAVEKMSCHSGAGLHEAMGALRIWWHGLMFRIEQSRNIGMKNFRSTTSRPWAPLVMDEASKLLGEHSEYRKEATFIINAGATMGRSMGMPIVGADQLLQLKQWGGDSAIRDNLLYGGSLVLHRSDSSQKHLIDLPENFAGCNPADIPAAWSGERDLVFDPNTPLNDPERTFGLSFAASPGAHAEMSRTWILEDSTEYIDTDNIAYPADWPFWDDRHALAEVSVLPSDQDDEDSDGFAGPTLFAGVDLAPKKPANAADKILSTLEDLADPAGLETNYTHKDTIGQLAGLEGSTLPNTLSDLVKAGKIHRQIDEKGKEVRGMYGLGNAPVEPATEEDEAA